MNRWSRIVLGVALAAAVGWVAVGVAGGGASRGPAGLTLHTLLAYGTVLAWVFADLWVVVFMAACVRAARRLAGAARPVSGELSRARRTVGGLGGAAIALALGQFAASGLLYPDRLPYALHVALAALALVAQLALIAAARRAFTGLEARIEAGADGSGRAA